MNLPFRQLAELTRRLLSYQLMPNLALLTRTPQMGMPMKTKSPDPFDFDRFSASSVDSEMRDGNYWGARFPMLRPSSKS